MKKGMGAVWTMVAAVGLVSAFAAVRAQPAPAQHDAEWHNRQALYLLNLKPEDGWSSTASGLRYRRVKPGTSEIRPDAGDTVTIHYVGRFIDGREFDSSIGGDPVTFPLPRLIRGWQEGVPLMEVGSTYEFAIPYTLAYGANGKGPIPGGATLLFTIELLGIEGVSAPS